MGFLNETPRTPPTTTKMTMSPKITGSGPSLCLDDLFEDSSHHEEEGERLAALHVHQEQDHEVNDSSQEGRLAFQKSSTRQEVETDLLALSLRSKGSSSSRGHGSSIGSSSDRRQGLLDLSIRESMKGGRRSDISYTLTAENIRPELKDKIQKWLLSFLKLDPRHKILTFFNEVAKEGADHLIDDDNDDCIYGHNSIQNIFGGSIADDVWRLHDQEESSSSYTDDEFLFPPRPPSSLPGTTLRGSMISKIFDTSSILTVWRPCSNQAMRRMMEGTGVGKGLDIKGKSAKQGLLSAFVPFMQIHTNQDKFKISPLKESSKLRIYFYSPQSRQSAIDTILSNIRSKTTNNSTPFSSESSNLSLSLYELLDSYTHKGLWGFEISQKLFWNGLILPQDITRGSDTETGRPSLPGFQDANMKTLKVACDTLKSKNHSSSSSSLSFLSKSDLNSGDDTMDFSWHSNNTSASSLSLSDEDDDKPVPVVLQYDKSNPCRAQTLVMAYEESGTVTPVVSDFDNFLLGWRREALWFGCNLPLEQEDLMMWSIDHVENLLQEQQQEQEQQQDEQQQVGENSDTDNGERGHGPTSASPSTPISWTVKWLDVLKQESREGFVPEIPEYGFGDPKSYGIMEKAAMKLKDTGAIRHGSECFNYYFPQEMDDYFLLVSDTFRPVPWKYVNEKELQQILIQKIREGFVFPLNPKWVLCDPGWKEVYDELMKSTALYAATSRDVWFPPSIGVLDRIEDICRRFPQGFVGPKKKEEDDEHLSLRDVFHLAVLELENFNERKKKMKLAKAMQSTGKSTRSFGIGAATSCISLGASPPSTPNRAVANKKMKSTPIMGTANQRMRLLQQATTPVLEEEDEEDEIDDISEHQSQTSAIPTRPLPPPAHTSATPLIKVPRNSGESSVLEEERGDDIVKGRFGEAYLHKSQTNRKGKSRKKKLKNVFLQALSDALLIERRVESEDKTSQSNENDAVGDALSSPARTFDEPESRIAGQRQSTIIDAPSKGESRGIQRLESIRSDLGDPRSRFAAEGNGQGGSRRARSNRSTSSGSLIGALKSTFRISRSSELKNFKVRIRRCSSRDTDHSGPSSLSSPPIIVRRNSDSEGGAVASPGSLLSANKRRSFRRKDRRPPLPLVVDGDARRQAIARHHITNKRSSSRTTIREDEVEDFAIDSAL